jgi:hypothetical protein
MRLTLSGSVRGAIWPEQNYFTDYIDWSTSYSDVPEKRKGDERHDLPGQRSHNKPEISQP